MKIKLIPIDNTPKEREKTRKEINKVIKKVMPKISISEIYK